MSRVRSIAKGGENSIRLAAEVKALSESNCYQKPSYLSIHIAPDHALVMKADLSIPWNKLLVLRIRR